MDATCELARVLQILSHRMNACLEYVDPEHYAEAMALRNLIRKCRASYDTLAHSDVLVYEGREILYNRQSGLHTDSQDPELSWALLSALGEHKGGHLFLPHLGLRVRLEPGDVIMLRGRVIPHEIEEWVGQRITIPHFTHSSMWRAMGNKTVFLP
jgi:hypothetical protein